jgi:hypothetical protein
MPQIPSDEKAGGLARRGFVDRRTGIHVNNSGYRRLVLAFSR